MRRPSPGLPTEISEAVAETSDKACSNPSGGYLVGSERPTVHRLFDSTPDFPRSAFLRHQFTKEGSASCRASSRLPTAARRHGDVGISVGSSSLVGMLVGNSSDAVINGRPIKKRPVLAGATYQPKMLRWCN